MGANISTFFPLATALLGGLLGASFTYWLQRARPLIVVDSIRLTADQSDDQINAKINRVLAQQLQQYETADLGFGDIVYKESVSESSYVSALVYAQLGLKDQIDNYLPRSEEATKEFREHIINEDYDLVDQSFARNAFFIWGPVAIASLRGQLKFSDPEPDWTKKAFGEPHHSINRDEHLFIIDMDGPLNAVFGTSDAPKPQADKLETLGTRLANAIIYRHRSDLLAAVQAARIVTEELARRAKELLAQINQELDPHRRFVIEGIISNAGRTAFSISNRAKFVVQMKGYRSRARTVEDDIDITLRLGVYPRGDVSSVKNEAQVDPVRYDIRNAVDLSTPVLVQPGQSRRFICVSDSLAKDLPYADELLQAFAGGDRNSYLALGSIRNKKRQFSVTYSRTLLFRDLVYTAELPRHSTWMGR